MMLTIADASLAREGLALFRGARREEGRAALGRARRLQRAAHVEASLTLTPGAIDADDARRMKAHFDAYRTAVTARKSAA